MRVLLTMASHCEAKKLLKISQKKGFLLGKKLRKKGSSISFVCVAMLYIMLYSKCMVYPFQYFKDLLVLLCSQRNKKCYITKKRIPKAYLHLHAAQIFDKITSLRTNMLPQNKVVYNMVLVVKCIFVTYMLCIYVQKEIWTESRRKANQMEKRGFTFTANRNISVNMLIHCCLFIYQFSERNARI